MRFRSHALFLALTLSSVLGLPAPVALATVSTETSSVEYTGNGSTTAFPTGFRFLANGDLVVKKKPLSGVYSTLTLGVDYTISGAGASSGTVTMLVAPAAGSTVRIERNVSLTQPKSLRTQGSFSPSIHEDALDRLTMAAQQLARKDGELDTSISAEAATRAAADSALSASIAGITGGGGTVTSVTSTGTTTSRLLADRFAETYNAKDYGAVGDGVTDDHAAIQAAIEAAGAAGGGKVYIPRGTYIIGSPLRIHHDGVRLTGESRSLTKLKKKTGTAGWLLVIAPEPTAFPGVTSLATGAGVGMNFDSTDSDWLDLSADADNLVTLDGKNNFTIEFFYKPTGPISEIRTLFNASNRRSIDETEHVAFSALVLTDGSMQVKTNIAGTLKQITTAAGVITAGNTKHIALTYDNVKIRLFVAGVNVGEIAATGAVQMPVLDHLTFGPYTYDLLENNHIFAGPRGVIDSIRVCSQYAEYTANFTPPTAKLAVDFATIALLNFDSVSGMLLGGTVGLAGAKTTKFLWHSNYDPTVFGSGGGGHSSVEHMYFDSGGIFTRATTSLYFDDIQFLFANTALALTNNSFLSSMNRLDATGAGAASVNFINTSASGVNTWSHITSSSCSYALYVKNSGVELDHLFLYASVKIPLVLLGGSGSTMSAIVRFANITDEAAIGTEANVLIDAGVSMVFQGSTFEAISNTMPMAKISGNKPVFFSGCTFTAKTGTTERIVFLNSGARTLPVVVQEPAESPSSDTTIPWCSTVPGMVVMTSAGKYSNTKGISATEVAANNLRGTCTISAAATSVTCTFPTAETNTSYYPVITPEAVSAGAASGSWRVKSVAKNVGSIVITPEAAPGGSETVKFNYILVR